MMHNAVNVGVSIIVRKNINICYGKLSENVHSILLNISKNI